MFATKEKQELLNRFFFDQNNRSTWWHLESLVVTSQEPCYQVYGLIVCFLKTCQFSFPRLWNSLSSCQEVVLPRFIHSQLMWCVWGNDLSIETLYYLIFTPQDIPYRTDHSTRDRDKASQNRFPDNPWLNLDKHTNSSLLFFFSLFLIVYMQAILWPPLFLSSEFTRNFTLWLIRFELREKTKKEREKTIKIIIANEFLQCLKIYGLRMEQIWLDECLEVVLTF